jgi:ABC-type lipoprotein export system ATPase subunit
VPEPIIAVRDITIRFGTTTVVEDLTAEVSAGESLCLAGRSGSGKTSVIRALAGVSTPAAGEITWWGEDISTMSEDRRRDLRRTRFGYVDQASTLLDELTLAENVLLPVLPEGTKRARELQPRAKWLLDALGIADRAGLHAGQLSGGERQRGSLARALLLDPEVLIVDEPTASLDRRWADEVIGVLSEYQRTGGAVIASSHDATVLDFADNVVHVESSVAESTPVTGRRH